MILHRMMRATLNREMPFTLFDFEELHCIELFLGKYQEGG